MKIFRSNTPPPKTSNLHYPYDRDIVPVSPKEYETHGTDVPSHQEFRAHSDRVVLC